MRSSLPRFLFSVIGIISLCLGILGIFLPLLPTTPFILLSSACFLRSSPRFYRWLNQHATFGTMIQNWQQHGAVSKAVKKRATLFIVLSFAFSIWMVPWLWLKVALFIWLVLLITWFIRLPTHELVANQQENH
ncbi:YbaN family protein [Vibrio cholerae]|uniref:YbaN family protein n=1 Tax=Vibrio cholerae TaxID=666 RepID=UPI00384E487F